MSGTAYALTNSLNLNAPNFVTAAGNVVMANEGAVVVKKTAGQATTVTLPPLPNQNVGIAFRFVIDAKGDAATNNITVQGSGADKINGAATYVINANYGAVLFAYDGAEWKALPFQGGSSGTGTFASLTVQPGLITESFVDNITALGTTQGTGAPLTAEVNRVTAGGAAAGVVLPAAAAGVGIMVINHAPQSIHVYGAGTDTIDDVATATGVVQMVSSVSIYYCSTSGPAGKWYSNGIGTGYAGSLPTVSFTEAITAGTTQTQAGGAPLTTILNRVTVANANDGVTLPVSAPGLELVVINATANTIKVYPNAGGTGTETINALAANAAYSLATVKTVTLYCTLAGQWHTMLSA